MINKLKILAFILWLTVPFGLIAQKQGQPLVDSLLKILSSVNSDKDKAILLNTLSHNYYYIKCSEGLKYGSQALDIAKKSDFKEELADAYDGIGVNFMGKGDYDTAINCYNTSQNIYEQLNDKKMIARELGNEGRVYNAQSDYPKALKYFLDALKLAEDAGDKNEIALLSGYISRVYVSESDFTKAMGYAIKALHIHQISGDQLGQGLDYGILGIVYMEMGKYDSASIYDFKSMDIHQKLGNNEELKNVLSALGLLYAKEVNYEKSLDYESQALKMDDELDDKDAKAINLAQIGEDNLRIAEDLSSKTKTMDFMMPMGQGENDKMGKAIEFLNQSVELSKEVGDLNNLQLAYSDLAEAQSTNGNYKDAREYYIQYELYRDSVYSEKSKMRIDNLEMQRNLILKDQQIQTANMQSARRRNMVIYMFGGLAFLLLILLFVIRERRRSENLLLNILPAQTAKELKLKGKAAANSYSLVTVMFTDFKNFTKLAENMTPQELVEEIHYCYSEFDKILSKHNVEKIKTIGDGYMAAGGLPIENKTNPVDTIMSALEIQRFMKTEKERRIREKKVFFELRIGINTGPVVAGIVGIKKFAYDIWGDTVNIASRIESAGEVGDVTISGTTYECVKDNFNCIYKGKTEAKNKGMIDVYVVESRKTA
ncbi:MAG TPA: adenylate/guanylate cyclase domain-containing protein [Bacteroidia bacterium]|jgi:adenylate cyclase|nr:adenylate/guanylate cyclase domain-containing protein [Bacteroidia bacterium]